MSKPLTDYHKHYCPKCGSNFWNSEKPDDEPRFYWCMDCGYGRFKPFPKKKDV